LNLLSVAAAYGLITLIFQDGRLQGLLGYTSFGGITWWVPLFMFVILFGMSMDYQVFILSRIREHWTRGSSPPEAIVEGIASSAGVVTSAALIMVAVFSIFLTLPFIELKVLGIGMAAAILIDATVVRGSCSRQRCRCSATAPGTSAVTPAVAADAAALVASATPLLCPGPGRRCGGTGRRRGLDHRRIIRLVRRAMRGRHL
jgi:hypothetical protein